MANEAARTLRKMMTPQEVKLWSRLRGLRGHGFHFRRQVPLDGYIVDFACSSARLVIEVDGSQHGAKHRAMHDRERDAHFARHGFTVLRFWNDEVDQEMEAVLTRIHAALEASV